MVDSGREAATATEPNRYGSDAIIDWIAAAGIDHVALNPGATLRGLHDSLVRHPTLSTILALHEEIAVGIAHGYAKASGKPMAVFLHDLVGLQHASMAIFNAFVDRVPMLLIGGSGPRAHESRRPWLDWIHTGLPQGSLVREFVKWDAEPATIDGVADVLNRAMRLTAQEPRGPVYVSIDTSLQEQSVAHDLVLGAGWPTPSVVVPSAEEVETVAASLREATAPVVVVDRPVAGLVQHLRWMAEELGAAVIDLGGGCNFPASHWADQTLARPEILQEADVVVTFEVRDVAFAISETDTGSRAVTPLVRDGTPVYAVGMSEFRHRGFMVPESMPAGVDFLLGEAAKTAGLICRAVGGGRSGPTRRRELMERHARLREQSEAVRLQAAEDQAIHPAQLASAVRDALDGRRWQLANGLLAGWPRRLWDVEEPDAYLGRSGGEGLGYGLPASIGAALAHRDDDMVVVDIQADGDLMYVPQALWTAAHHHLPVLVVMHNNRTYGKDELHQEEMAKARARSRDAVPIGIRLADPHIDFCSLARSQGVAGIGPVTEAAALPDALQQALAIIDAGQAVLVDVVTR